MNTVKLSVALLTPKDFLLCFLCVDETCHVISFHKYNAQSKLTLMSALTNSCGDEK